MVLEVLFWVLLILCVIGLFAPESWGQNVTRGRWVVFLILFTILGLRVFGAIK